MAMLVVCRAKAGGWASTTALAVAACWPDPRWSPVVECDQGGGALAARCRVRYSPGLVELAADARPGAGVEVLARYTQQLACGVDVVVGPVRPRQARSAVRTLAAAPGVLAGAAGTVVVTDVGHLAPDTPGWPLLGVADGVLVCAPPSLDGLAAGIALLDEIRAAWPSARVWLVLTGAGGYRLSEVRQAVDPVPVAGHLPHDARTAAALTDAGTRLPRTPLGRAARQIAQQLAGSLAPVPVTTPRAVTGGPGVALPAGPRPPLLGPPPVPGAPASKDPPVQPPAPTAHSGVGGELA